MKIKSIPFNLDFVQDIPATYAGLLPIRSLQMFEGMSGDYHPQGLYSNIVFGRPGDDMRATQLSYIDMKATIFHPLYYKELIQLKALYEDILLSRGYATWDDKEKDFVRADILTGETGYAFFMEHFHAVVFKRNKSQQRDLRIDLLEKFRKQAFIRRLYVIPAGIRDVELSEDGQPKEEDINPLYRKVVSVSNTINTAIGDDNSSMLDGSRASLQTGVVAIYDYIFAMLEGKKGFLQGKFAARRITGSTRNVLSSMEVGSTYLGDARQPGINTTIVGMFQFMKGCQPLILDYAFKNKFLYEFYESLNDGPMLINTKTLQPEQVVLRDKTRDKWGTEAGLEDTLNGFADATLRHKPVMIDGHYLKLIYQDAKYYRVMDSIDELPDGWNRQSVRPMSWAELFYLHAKDFVNKTRSFNTRYPVTGLGSIYVSEVYVKTTVSGLHLKELDVNWIETEHAALEFPDTGANLAFFDTMSVSPYMLGGLGADFDINN